jgi:putative MATE family efflux protein
VTVSLMGGRGAVADGAVLYLRISAVGAPLFMLASAGQGFLRGMSDLRTPLVILIVAHTVNAVLELLFVYGFGWGLAGSAWGTVIAQLGMGAAFVVVQARAGLERPQWARMRRLTKIGGEIAVRTSALLASFLVASAVLARVGAASLGAHQIALQLWLFLALVLDAYAIAAQTLVGHALGAGRPDDARGTVRTVLLWGLGTGVVVAALLLVLRPVLLPLFTPDPAVLEQARLVWWFLAGMQPLAGMVFALDGVLMGAGDVGYLRTLTIGSAVVGFLPLSLLSLPLGWGLAGVWTGLTLFIVLRLGGVLARVAGTRWLAAPAVTTA